MSVLTKPDIRRPETIDALWLTGVLQCGGVDAVVKRFAAQAIGTGQIGDSVRFTFEYERAGADAPPSLVGKFPALNEVSRNAGATLGTYLREVRFYQQLAATALIRTPRCYFTDVHEPTSEFVLMMEDLAPAEPGDQLVGVTLKQARDVVVQAALLHASHWDDESLDLVPWVSGSKTAPPSRITPEACVMLWQGFKDRYGPRMQDNWIATGDWLSRCFVGFNKTIDGPRCLIHNDFRPDNMMFSTPAGGCPVTVLDWQSFAYGSGSTDLAYFLAGSLDRETRRRHEPGLLQLYYETLTANGVTGYSLSDLERNYGRGAYQLFFTGFFAAMVVKQTERGDQMFLQMLGSASDHLADHGVTG